MGLLDYALATLAVVAITWCLLNIFFPPATARLNVVLLTFALLTTAVSVFVGVPLLVGKLLYSQVLNFDTLTNLLVFLILAAALSALVLEFEGPATNVLESLGVDKSQGEVGFTFVHGLTTALLLILVSRLLPSVELMSSAALAAGLIGAFGFYFAEQLFVHWRSSDTEQMASGQFPSGQDD